MDVRGDEGGRVRFGAAAERVDALAWIVEVEPLLARLGVHTSYVTTILPGLVIFGAGLGFTFSPAMNFLAKSVAPIRSSNRFAGIPSSSRRPPPSLVTLL